MITKKEKIWMWIFIAMFVVPEILWGNLVKIINISFLPIFKNSQFFTDNPVVAFAVIMVEIIGISATFYLLNKKYLKEKLVLKYIVDTILIVIFLALLVSLYLSYVATQISFF
jgi:hypothetical protein